MTGDARYGPTPIGAFWRQLAQQYGDTYTIPATGPRPARTRARIAPPDRPATPQVAQLALDLTPR